MRVEQLLLWSLNAVMSDGSVGVDRPDRMSCGLTTGAASSGVCLPEGMVVWLGRYVVPRKNESLAALCGRYQCTAGVGLRLTTFSVSKLISCRVIAASECPAENRGSIRVVAAFQYFGIVRTLHEMATESSPAHFASTLGWSGSLCVGKNGSSGGRVRAACLAMPRRWGEPIAPTYCW